MKQFQRKLETSSAAREYLRDRLLTEVMIAQAGLGYDPEHRSIAIPVRDMEGQIRDIRLLPTDAEAQHKAKAFLHGGERDSAGRGSPRVYDPLGFGVLREYYYPYNRAYAGNAGARFRTRKDLLKGTMYPSDEYVFAGLSEKGYVVFPPLHDDVQRISIHLNQIGLRFDFRDEATHTRDLVFNFEREVHRE